MSNTAEARTTKGPTASPKRVHLSPDDWQRFQDALIDPPAPNAALRQAFADYLTATE